MKKFLVVAVAVALSLPALAWSSAPTAGKYEGKITSEVKELNGQPVTMEVKTEGGKVVANVAFTDGKEVWTWDDKTLTQKELGPDGKVAREYGATFTNGAYYVNCKDKAKNVCDADIDSRVNWKLVTTPDQINYILTGVAKAEKGDPNAKVRERINIALKLKK